MKTQHFLYKSEGLYYIKNMPVMEQLYCDCIVCIKAAEVNYKNAIERAKAEAVKVKDFELEVLVPNHHYPTVENTIYTINMEEKIEIVDGNEIEDFEGSECYPIYKQIARIAAPKKEEESESQEEDGNLYAILITNTFTKVITLYPVCYKTIGEAEISINGIPRLKYANTFDVVEIKRKPL